MNLPAWRELFCTGGTEPDFTLPLSVVRKHGAPLVLLPPEHALAARALDLYPAQTLQARAARGLLRGALRAGWPVPLGRFAGPVHEAAPFARFLRALAGGRWPGFAVLLGNPRTPGQRWLVLVFAPDGAPQFVVKAGVGSAACALIDAELAALDAIPRSTAGVPLVRERWTGANAAAFALDYIGGSSPRVPDDDGELARILESWIDPTRRVTLADIPAWQCVRAASADAGAIEQALAGRTFHPAIFHGDFAPWNVKAVGDEWTVLDWERGSPAGVPAWDWFHFVIQPALLVRRLPPEQVFARIAALLRSAAFQRYAASAEIAEFTGELLRGYLLYMLEVVRPADGLAELRALRDLALQPPR